LGHNVDFISSSVGDEVEQALQEPTRKEPLFLLENVRFHKGEKENSEDFARMLAKPFDVYINDAFSVCHRDQASVTNIAKYLPAFAGLHLQEEINTLSDVENSPEKPAVAIIGGAKIETKLPMLRMFEKLYDTVLVGGRIANEALDAKDRKENSLVFSKNVLFPVDFVGDRFDIGQKTVKLFSEKIHGAKTIIWNGPMGKFEEKRYSNGTDAVTREIVKSGAFSVVGGGESLEALEKNGLLGKFSFVSTGGGALLAFLGGDVMPGLEVLKK